MNPHFPLSSRSVLSSPNVHNALCIFCQISHFRLNCRGYLGQIIHWVGPSQVNLEHFLQCEGSCVGLAKKSHFPQTQESCLCPHHSLYVSSTFTQQYWSLQPIKSKISYWLYRCEVHSSCQEYCSNFLSNASTMWTWRSHVLGLRPVQFSSLTTKPHIMSTLPVLPPRPAQYPTTLPLWL